MSREFNGCYIIKYRKNMKKSETVNELKKYRYAHRGLHNKPRIPENSLAAFSLAVEKGFGIEFDVRLTFDKKLAVIHDSSLKRVTTVREDGRAVLPENINYPSETICRSDAIIETITLEDAKNHPLEESDERIPEMREVLELVDGRVPLIIELKPTRDNFRELTNLVMKELEGYVGLYAVESFNSFAVKYLKKAYPDVVRGQLATDLIRDEESLVEGDPRERVHVGRVVNYLVRELVMNPLSKPDFVGYKFEHRKNGSFKKYKGMKVFWTIKTPLDMELSEKNGIICIFERFTPEDRFFGGRI